MLQVLKNSSPCLRQAILKKANPALIDTISEISKNILNGNVPLKPKTKSSLRKYKEILRKLSSQHPNKLSCKKRRQLLCRKNQTGGFLPLLLEPVIAGLVTALISKYG